jgi:hypothetical protein
LGGRPPSQTWASRLKLRSYRTSINADLHDIPSIYASIAAAKIWKRLSSKDLEASAHFVARRTTITTSRITVLGWMRPS